MRRLCRSGVAAIFLAGAATAAAADLKSGLQVGEFVGAFDVVKCAGPEDGVQEGQQLCYRWKYGGKPVVMIFARKSDAALASLVKQLDTLVAEHADEQLSAFVNLIGEDRDALEADAKQFAAKHKIENIPVVVPVEFENGPDNFGINPKAELTVMLYKALKVQANHAYGPDQFKSKTATEVLDDVPKLLK